MLSRSGANVTRRYLHELTQTALFLLGSGDRSPLGVICFDPSGQRQYQIIWDFWFFLSVEGSPCAWRGGLKVKKALFAFYGGRPPANRGGVWDE
jgi:hypothetical protein